MKRAFWAISCALLAAALCGCGARDERLILPEEEVTTDDAARR